MNKYGDWKASEPIVKRGDLFCVEGIGLISKMIKARTGGVYSHAGIITNEYGHTFEALKKIERAHISRYRGKRILILRPIADEGLIDEAIKILEDKWDDKVYPYWRLISHLLGWPFDKFDIAGLPVCSELVSYYLYLIELWDVSDIWGTNPDDISDECIAVGDKKFQIIKRGRL